MGFQFQDQSESCKVVWNIVKCSILGNIQFSALWFHLIFISFNHQTAQIKNPYGPFFGLEESQNLVVKPRNNILFGDPVVE